MVERMFRILMIFSFLVVIPGYGNSTFSSQAAFESIKRPGHFVLFRHALAPGTGDPLDFKIGDCATQRNLSDTGREQARALGNHFRAAGIEKATVLSSQWCRCLETARLLDLGEVAELPALNSFYEAPQTRSTRLEQFQEWLQIHPLDGPTVLVTHQVTISALTGEFTGSGDGVVVEHLGDGKLKVVGKIRLNGAKPVQ